jgi:DNA-binding transcriptional regulator YdaS (Cro superfamily)
MKFETALAHYGSQAAIARVLGLKRQHVFSWKDLGVIPAKHAVTLEVDSKGKVKVDPKVYERQGAKPRV